MSKENILAIPSKGSFRDESLKLLSDAGIKFEISGRQLTTEASLPRVGKFTLALMRPKDIVKMTISGEIPLGIAGEDIVEESILSMRGIDFDLSMLPLGIGRCRLVLATSEGSGLKTEQELSEANFLQQFGGCIIATSYPNLTRRCFIDRFEDIDYMKSYPNFSMRELAGSVEAAIALGMADAISDLVETGITLRDNGLREIGTLFNSQGVLITNRMATGRSRFVSAIHERLERIIP